MTLTTQANRQRRQTVRGLALAASVAVATFAFSTSISAQHRQGGDSGSSGTAVPRTSAPAPSSGGGSSSSGGGAQTRSTGGESGRSEPQAAQRGGDRNDGGGRARAGDSGGDHGGTTGDRATARPREGRPATGQAVQRRPGSTGGGRPVIVAPGGYWGDGFYPWGYGGLGFGGYYGGLYDPWGYGGYGYGGGYGYDSYPSSYSYDGALRLKVKPRDAEVYVDGYYAGRVDDFDGTFQRLHIESGPHRIEVRAPGYEPLMFDVRIQPDHTTNYTGELKRVP